RIIRKRRQRVMTEHKHLRINPPASTAAVFSAGNHRAGEAGAAVRKRMKIDAAGVAAGVPQRIMGWSPSGQFLGLLGRNALARRRELVAFQPAAFNGREYGLFNSHGIVADFTYSIP